LGSSWFWAGELSNVLCRRRQMEGNNMEDHQPLVKTQSTIGTTRIRTGIWPTPEHTAQAYAESLARANIRRWMHQSANDSIRSVHRLLDNVASSITFGFSSTTMNQTTRRNQKPMINAITKWGTVQNDTRRRLWTAEIPRNRPTTPGTRTGCNDPSPLETPSRQSKLSTLLRIGLAWFQLQSALLPS
jgi:hypothetical protein